MPYTGLIPSIEAIQQAVREPLSDAPRDHQAFAVYIFERAREIDRERVITSTSRSNARVHRRPTASPTPQ